MCLHRVALLCVCLTPLALDRSIRAAGAESDSADEQTLQAVGLATDGPALLEFFRKRAQPDFHRDQVAHLLRQLSDKETGDQAAGELVALGAVALPLL